MPDEVTVPAGNEAPTPALPTEQAGEGVTQPVVDTPTTVTLDGQEYTLDDLRSGIMRQADYTRKTQDLATERQQVAQATALWSALGEDPKGAIEALQEHFAEALTPGETLEPEEARWREVQTFMEKQQERDALANVNAELARLSTRFGAFDKDALLQHAIDRGIPDLEVALIHQRATSQQVQAQAQQQAADAAALAAKQALPAVAGGSHALGATGGSGKAITTVKGALAEALAEAGLDSLSSLS